MTSWIKEAVFYHIYPLGFVGAAQYHEEEITHSIKKVEDWIPHMKKLGVNALYLGPVFESHEHGYDTSDYRLLDHRLGTNDDFKRVCDSLHAADIRIVLDGVFNHVGRDFWAFRDVQEKKEKSTYCDWFSNLHFHARSPLNDDFTYDAWEGHYNLVKLNLENEEVVRYLLDSVAMWMDEFHIDGLRLDAADCIRPEFFRRLKAFCKEKNPDFWLMGEIIHGDYNRWANPDMLDSVTNYECYKGLYSSHNERNYFEIGYSLNRQFGNGGIYQGLDLYNFVDNHDVNRLASTVKNKEDLFNIYTILFTMPGIPSIYYGSEYAVEGRKHNGSDADIRPCLQLCEFDSEKLCEHLALLSFVHKMRACSHGSYEQVLLRNEQFVFCRSCEQDSLYIACNVADADYEAVLPIPQGCWKDFLRGTTYRSEGGSLQLTIPAKSSCILYKDNESEQTVTEDCSISYGEAQDLMEEEQSAVYAVPIFVKPLKEAEGLPVEGMEVKPGKYRHFKGKCYSVLYVATHSETLERYVVYRQLYGNEEVWIRPLAMFCESILVDGVLTPRFTYIGK